MMTIWSSTQNPHILRTMIAGMLDLGESQVRAIAPEVGGGFGAKINIYPEEYVAAAVSKRLSVPVKWIEDRSEAFVATTHGRDIIGYIEMAAKRDGQVLGVKLRLIADIGAYNTYLGAMIPTLTMLMANATYDFPAIRTTLTEVFTNKLRPTPTAGRGVPRPPTSSNGAWTCWRSSWTWTRRNSAGGISFRRTSFPSTPKWARSTTPATTRRRSMRG